MQMLPYNKGRVDVHYFDNLHKLLLQYIHDGKYEELLLVLNLPHICESVLFWQTCTYQAGIIAVILHALIKKNRDNAHVSCNLNETDKSNKLGVNIHDVYHLLQHCVRVHQTIDHYTNSNNSNVLCINNHLSQELEQQTNTLGKDVLLESLLSEIEKDSADAHIDLPVIYAVLREQCYRLEYINPFADNAKKNVRAIVPLKTYSHEIQDVQRCLNKNNNYNVETAEQIILAASRLVHGTDEEDKENPESTATTNDTSDADNNLDGGDNNNNKDNTNGKDAVALLQHIAPLSNTIHIAASFDEVANDNNINNANDIRGTDTTYSERNNDKGNKINKESEVVNDMIDNNSQQRNESKDRIAQIINAFDMFNAGEEGDDPTNTNNVRQSSNHSSHSSSLSSIATPTSGANATHHAKFAKASSHADEHHPNRSRGNGEYNRFHDNINNLNNNVYTSHSHGNTNRNYKRRRTHYTDAENTAIIHGVARYGQMPRNFPIIFESYKEVWLPGRTPMKLYDHWRDSLRRSAINDDSNFQGDE